MDIIASVVRASLSCLKDSVINFLDISPEVLVAFGRRLIRLIFTCRVELAGFNRLLLRPNSSNISTKSLLYEVSNIIRSLVEVILVVNQGSSLWELHRMESSDRSPVL